MSEKPKRPTDGEYAAARVRIAFDFAPRIYPCAHCGWPVADGHCCRTCRSADPHERDEDGDDGDEAAP